jgi:hypothetical protein
MRFRFALSQGKPEVCRKETGDLQLLMLQSCLHWPLEHRYEVNKCNIMHFLHRYHCSHFLKSASKRVCKRMKILGETRDVCNDSEGTNGGATKSQSAETLCELWKSFKRLYCSTKQIIALASLRWARINRAIEARRSWNNDAKLTVECSKNHAIAIFERILRWAPKSGCHVILTKFWDASECMRNHCTFLFQLLLISHRQKAASSTRARWIRVHMQAAPVELRYQIPVYSLSRIVCVSCALTQFPLHSRNHPRIRHVCLCGRD